MSHFSFRGAVHLNFVDISLLKATILGYIVTLKGEIDAKVVIDLNNKASLAFLQKHLGKKLTFFDKINQMILRTKLS